MPPNKDFNVLLPQNLPPKQGFAQVIAPNLAELLFFPWKQLISTTVCMDSTHAPPPKKTPFSLVMAAYSCIFECPSSKVPFHIKVS